jgi:hypothetical protein
LKVWFRRHLMETEPRRDTSYDRPLRKRFPKLRKHKPELSSPDYLRSVVKQGRHGAARSRDMLPQQKVRTGLLNAPRKK